MIRRMRSGTTRPFPSLRGGSPMSPSVPPGLQLWSKLDHCSELLHNSEVTKGHVNVYLCLCDACVRTQIDKQTKIRDLFCSFHASNDQKPLLYPPSLLIFFSRSFSICFAHLFVYFSPSLFRFFFAFHYRFSLTFVRLLLFRSLPHFVLFIL